MKVSFKFSMEIVPTLELLQHLILEEKALLLYFSHEHCSVCKVLKPKVSELISERFPRMKARYVDTERTPLLAGQFSVFAVPTLLLFFDGREQTRYSRNFSLDQLEGAIERPYTLLFGEDQ